jgi:hypothetical protein
VTLPAKKYRSWKRRQRIGNIKLGLVVVGIMIGLFLSLGYLLARDPYVKDRLGLGRISIDLKIEDGWPALVYLFSILGVLVFLFIKLGAKVPYPQERKWDKWDKWPYI